MIPVLSNRAVQLSSLALFVILIAASFFRGSFGDLGPDNDDVMRLIQIRDFLQGQSWFDLTQYRMGPEGGTPMHWSRLVDIPYILLISFLDLFLSYELAEAIAITLVPPLYACMVLVGVAIGMQHIGGRYSIGLACLIIALSLFVHFRFFPGAIDHHNLQIALLAIAVGCVIDPEKRRIPFVVAGIATALSASIGTEVYIFVGFTGGFVALLWLWFGADIKQSVELFGLAFASTLCLVFITTIPPAAYGVLSCDAMSYIMVLAGGVGGIGLFAAAKFLSNTSLISRAAVLGGLAVVIGLMGVLIAPTCLANPLEHLPPIVKELWLDQIIEAQPLFNSGDKWYGRPLYVLGPALLALVISALQIKNKTFVPQYLFLSALLISALALTIMQLRFFVFAHLFAMFTLCAWVARRYLEAKSPDGNDVAYIMPLAISLPFFWLLPDTILNQSSSDISEEPAAACYSDNVMTAMNALPMGRFAATSNGTPNILQFTDQKVLTGNYHRNVSGIQDTLILFTSDPVKSEVLIRKNKIDYVHVCRTTGESENLKKQNETSLIADLMDRKVPGYLEQIGDDLEDGAVTLYKVLPAH